MAGGTRLKYEIERYRGIISSAGAVWHPDGKHVLSAAGHLLLLIDTSLDTVTETIFDDSIAEITCFYQHPILPLAAFGYADGRVRLVSFSSTAGTPPVATVAVYRAHLTRIECVTIDSTGQLVGAGGGDTFATVFDVVSGTLSATLGGHTAAVTAACFATNGSHTAFVTGSRDKTLRVWDLDSCTASATLTRHRGAVTAAAADPWSNRIFTCAADPGDCTVHVWSYDPVTSPRAPLTLLGAVPRALGKEYHVTGMSVHPAQPVLVLQTHSAVEIYRMAAESDARRRARKAARKVEEGKTAAAAGGAAPAPATATTGDITFEASYYLPEVAVAARAGSGVKITGTAGRRAASRHEASGFARIGGADEDEEHLRANYRGPGTGIELMVATNANNLARTIYRPLTAFTGGQTEEPRVLEAAGHRTALRAMDYDADSNVLVTASSGMVKIWETKTMRPSRTQKGLKEVTTVALLPGGRFAVVGQRNGQLIILSTITDAVIDVIDAHDGPVTSIKVAESGMSAGGVVVATAGGRAVNLWGLKAGATRSTVSLVLERTLEADDAVSALALSPPAGAGAERDEVNGRETVRRRAGTEDHPRYIAMALADNTIRVFYFDKLGFHLSLYGHALPAAAIDFSSDGALLASASGDRSIRLWGVDFGDCHRILRSHLGAVTGVAFVRDTHLLLSCARDGTVRYWDGDSFKLLQTLQPHNNDVLGIALSPTGMLAVTIAQDRSICQIVQTDQQIFDTDEIAADTARAVEAELIERRHRGAAGEIRTLASSSDAERIQEALLNLRHEDARRQEWSEGSKTNPFMPSPLLMGLTGHNYFLKILRDSCKTATLADAFAQITVDECNQSIDLLTDAVEAGVDVEFAARWLLLMVRMHFRAYAASGERFRIRGARAATALSTALGAARSTYGKSLAALQLGARENAGGRWVRMTE